MFDIKILIFDFGIFAKIALRFFTICTDPIGVAFSGPIILVK